MSRPPGKTTRAEARSAPVAAPAPAEPANEATAQMLGLVGRRIRELRKARDLTLSQLADLCGISSSMLSMVERGLTAPSIASLMVLAEALGKTASELIAAPSSASDLVVRGADVRPAEMSARGVRRVMKEDRVNGVTISINEYAPDGDQDEPARAHEGHEYGLLLEGELVVEVEGEAYQLGSGDLISFASRRPHRMWNEGVSVARSIWVDIDRK